MPAAEADRLFDVVDRLAGQGLGVMLVTHHLDEVFRVAHVATVLRDGRRVATRPIADLTEKGLVDLMVGNQLEKAEHARRDQSVTVGPECLTVRALTTEAVYEVDLTVARREIVGVAGIDGSGRVELLEAISGNRTRTGEVRVNGSITAGNRPHAARRAGLGYVPADRTRNSTFADFDVTANITAPGLTSYLRAGLLSPRAERREVDTWVQRLDIKPPNAAALIGSLSGGNQQKAVVARWLARKPAILVMVEPTQGVDVAARDSIYAAVRIAAEDSGVLIGSSDSEELAAICDRVLILRRGHICAELSGPALTAAAIDRLCLAAAEPEANHA
jgi:ribose transport system ATP-binding protein